MIDNLLKLLDIKNKKNFFKILNISSGKKIKIFDLVKLLEKKLQKKAKIILEKKLSTDITASLSYSSELKKIIKVRKPTTFNFGISKFISWYKNYYNV